jgi:hypothetical protein
MQYNLVNGIKYHEWCVVNGSVFGYDCNELRSIHNYLVMRDRCDKGVMKTIEKLLSRRYGCGDDCFHDYDCEDCKLVLEGCLVDCYGNYLVSESMAYVGIMRFCFDSDRRYHARSSLYQFVDIGNYTSDFDRIYSFMVLALGLSEGVINSKGASQYTYDEHQGQLVTQSYTPVPVSVVSRFSPIQLCDIEDKRVYGVDLLVILDSIVGEFMTSDQIFDVVTRFCNGDYDYDNWSLEIEAVCSSLSQNVYFEVSDAIESYMFDVCGSLISMVDEFFQDMDDSRNFVLRELGINGKDEIELFMTGITCLLEYGSVSVAQCDNDDVIDALLSLRNCYYYDSSNSVVIYDKLGLFQIVNVDMSHFVELNITTEEKLQIVAGVDNDECLFTSVFDSSNLFECSYIENESNHENLFPMKLFTSAIDYYNYNEELSHQIFDVYNRLDSPYMRKLLMFGSRNGRSCVSDLRLGFCVIDWSKICNLVGWLKQCDDEDLKEQVKVLWICLTLNINKGYLCRDVANLIFCQFCDSVNVFQRVKYIDSVTTDSVKYIELSSTNSIDITLYSTFSLHDDFMWNRGHKKKRDWDEWPYGGYYEYGRRGTRYNID